MFCSLRQFSKILVEDVRSISNLLAHSGDDKMEVDSKVTLKRKFETDGLIEQDANPLTEDESEDETTTQEWPVWESTSEAENAKADDLNSTSKWLKNCLIASSPDLEIVVMAEVQNLVILERSSKKSDQMQLSAEIKIEVRDLSDYITAIQVLPLASTRKSEASLVDWNCIVVALSSGYVNFYTERGILILQEHVSNGPIQHLRFGQSFFPGNQELVALSGNCLYVMEGLSLFTVLKTARNEIARGERTVTEISDDLPINAHCLQFDRLRKANDVHLLGIDKPKLFDQFSSHSQDRQLLRNLASTCAHIYCSTSSSMALFLVFDLEQTNRHALSDTIQHYSSKLTASIPSIGFRSFFNLGQSRRDRPQKAEVVSARRIRIDVKSRLQDPGRRSDRSFVAFGAWNLIAICDENARVLLVDTKKGSVIRIWKGYRNARCAFIETIENTDNTKSSKRKRVLFLVIFAPKRGLLEIWSLCFGPRVAAFNVDPKGRLITIPLAKEGILLGQSSTNISNQSSPTVGFLLPNGTFQTISIPFHFAALANANRLHDENLLKESNLNELIKIENNQLNSQQFIQALNSLKAVDSQKRLIERVFGLTLNRKLSPIDVDKILNSCLDIARPDLQIYLLGLQRITQVYLKLSNHNRSIDSFCDYEKLRDNLSMSVEEYEDLLSILIESTVEVSFPHLMYLGEFREQFAFVEGKSVILSQQADRLKLALHIFAQLFYSETDDLESNFNEIMKQLQILSDDFLELFLLSWHNEWNKKPWTLVQNACKILSLIIGLFDDSSKTIEIIEQSIYQSGNSRSALFLLLIHRAIERKQNGDSDQQMEWETLDERTAWHFLASRHLSIMSLMEEFNLDSPLGLSKLAEKGFGFYREQVGQFVASSQIESEKLINLARNARKPTDENDTPTLSSFNDRILTSIFQQFPYSFVIELILCDCSWECSSRWFRNDQFNNRKIQHLELAIEYLSHMNVVARLQHGLSLMIWDTFVRTPFERLFSFIEANEGKMPRDRLLRSEVFVTEMELPRFIKCIRQLLKILQMSVVDLEAMPMIEHKYEDFVENFFENRRIKVKKNRHHTLTQLATGQHSINYHLVLHHIHLVICIELQLVLNLRVPLNQIFSDIARRAFFADFHEHPLIPIKEVDDAVQYQRQSFVEQVVSAVGIQNDQNYHDRWELINELTKDWALDADLLRIKEIVMLHEGNYDKDAEKLYPTVQHRNLLASKITPVAIGRFKALIENNEGLKSKAPKKLKQITWNAVKSLPDEFLPNFEPTLAETLSLITAVLYMFGYSTKPSKQHYQQLNTSNEKRLLTELCDFIKSNTED